MSLKESDLKVIVLGDSGVGKTTLINVFVTEEFRADFKATIGADFTTKSIQVDVKEKLPRIVNLQIWDTAGEERFHSVGPAFYRGTEACILVFDVTNRRSFERLENWRQSLLDKTSDISPDLMPFVIFANKSDLDDQRAVSLDEAEAYAKQRGIQLFEVSAKTKLNVENGFQKIAIEGLKVKLESNNKISMLKVNEKKNGGNCC